ncbi:hypothetical protein E8E14_005076 [Neopestalotiopsis sp. 37M]|nr:hypothetical protein E8E14_005076 [Neopestalotiopsis sp. 37M]
MDRRDQEYDEDSTEQTPLIQQNDQAGRQNNNSTHQQQRRPPHRPMLSMASIASIASVNVPKAHSGDTIVSIFCAIALVVCCANGFANVPLTKIVENLLCDEFYEKDQRGIWVGFGSGGGDGPVVDPRCKIPEIQSKMAYIFAAVEASDAIVGSLAALPWGFAADRLGRRPVAAIALLGLAMSILWIMAILYFGQTFTVALAATASLWRFVGGGSAVLVAILLSMISDVIPEEKRATAFMRLHVSNLVGSLVSPALSSAMLRVTGPWPVMFVAVGCVLAGAVAFLFVPETMQHKPVVEEEEHANEQHSDDDSRPRGLRGHVDHAVKQLRHSISMVKSASLVILLLTCLASSPIAGSVAQFLVQFVSKRYEIPIESTGYVQSAYGVAQVVHALLLLPWLSAFLLKDKAPGFLRMPNEQVRDLVLARWSFGLLALAFFVMTIAPELWMFIAGLCLLALGSAAQSLVKSLMSLYVDQQHRSRLYTLVGIVDTVGGLYGPAMLAGLFSLGMKKGGIWIGLPYFGVMVITLVVVILLLFIKVPKQNSEERETTEEGRTHQD